MQRKLNSLHWPYIGAVALDRENRVALLFEMSLLGRGRSIGFPAYFCESLLIGRVACNDFGLKRSIARESLHLKSKVWLEQLGQRLFNEC
jgi:hypothetical protein